MSTKCPPATWLPRSARAISGARDVLRFVLAAVSLVALGWISAQAERFGYCGGGLSVAAVVLGALAIVLWLALYQVRAIRRLSREQRESEDRRRSLMESSREPIVSVDAEGRIIEFNRAAEQTFGYQRSQVLGRLLSDCVAPPEVREIQRVALTRLLLGGRGESDTRRMELRALRADRREIPIELVRIDPVVADTPSFTVVIRDLSGEREREAIRQKSQALEEENRRVMEASRIKSEFLANLSHEIRTPLNAVIGFSQLLLDDKAGPLGLRQREYLTDVLTAGQYLLQLINDILDLSKIEAGKLELHVEPFSLPLAVEEVCAIMRPIAAKKNVTIRASLPDEDTVRLDPRKFKQVLYNLLSNAVKFSHENGEVELIVGRDRQGRVRLEVRDHGIGIRSEDMSRLFREFEQIDSGLVRRYQGTGLGLALTKKIVELQQGSIQVQSEPGRGSTFTVSIPGDIAPEPGEVREWA